MLPNQAQPGQLVANNQANATPNLIKFDEEKPYEAYYSNLGNTIKTIALLDHPSEIIKHIPKNFTITTKNGSYKFNDLMLKDTSIVISEFIKENPNSTKYHIDIEDYSNVMGKVENMYNGERVTFDMTEINVLRQITSSLNINCCPAFMKSEGFGKQDMSCSYGQDHLVKIDKENLKIFLDQKFPKTLTISTNNDQYECNLLGVKSSTIINEQLEKNPDLESYHFDFDDELNNFQEICNFFNFMPIKITTNNMHVLKKIADDLQINYIIKPIADIIESYEMAVKKIDEKKNLVNTIVDLCNDLYNIKNLGVENFKEKIINSVWSTTEENVQELACYLIQVVYNDLSLHPYIYDLLIILDKSSNESNELRILLPYFIKQIMLAFPKSKLNCAFVFRLIQNRFVSINDALNKIASQAKILNSRQEFNYDQFSSNNKSEKEIFISQITNTFEMSNEIIEPIYLKNGIVWFYPELMNNEDVKLLMSKDPFIHQYFPNEIDRYKKMRESYESDNEITKAINIDDVDTLQRIINQYKSLNNTISYNMFDTITERGGNSFINYAASKGSIKCFKYLLLNHAELDESSLYYAVLGKNVEIIRIVDQYLSDQNIDVDYKFNFNDRYYDNEGNLLKDVDIAPIIPAISMHQNAIFDWILEQKYINDGITGNSLFDVAITAAKNGNAHAFIQCVDKGFDINSLSTDLIKEILQQSMINGFYKLTQLIISLLSSEIVEDYMHCLFEIEDSVLCGNLSIMKLYLSSRKESAEINKGVLIAAKRGYLNIISKLLKSDFVKLNEFQPPDILRAFILAVQNHQTKIFEFLIYFTPLPLLLPETLLYLLLSYISYLGDFEVLTMLTDFLIRKDNFQMDLYTNCFLYSACLNHENICKYLIELKVSLDYNKLISKSMVLTCCNREIFSTLYDYVDSETKELFRVQLLSDSIKNQNIGLIDFLFEKGSPFNNSLYEAVLTNNVDVVKVVLKYNKKPYFINKLYKSGTVLNKAVVLGNYEIAKLLLSIPGIDPSLYANNNITPLVSAITSLRMDLIDLILEFYGNDIESQAWQLNEALKLILKKISVNKKPSSNYQDIYDKCNEVQEEEEEEGFEDEREKEMSIQINKSEHENNLIISVLCKIIQIKNVDLNCHEDKYTILSFACEINRIDLVSMLIKSGKVNVNSYTPNNGNTPLMIAIENKNIEIAKLLINLPQTNINLRNYNNKTALIFAVENGLQEIVKLIISNERFDPEESLLDYAFFVSIGQISKQLFSLKQLDVNYKYFEGNDEYDDEDSKNASSNGKSTNNDKSFETTLVNAVEQADIEKIELILKHPSFDPIKSQINIALFTSVNASDIRIFKSLLLRADNDVNICFESKLSLLIYSIDCNRDQIVEEIINNKKFDLKKNDILSAFVETYQFKKQMKQQNNDDDDDDDYQNDMTHASLKSMDLICKFDENHNHSIDFTKLLPDGKSFFTAMNPTLDNSGDVANFLLKHGVDPDKPDKFGQYPLNYCIENDLNDAAIVLIRSKRVDLNRKFTIEETQVDVEDSTYLHLAASQKSSEVLAALLELNIIDINYQNIFGETPLVNAIRSLSLDNIELLFSKDNLEYDNNIIYIAKETVGYTRNDGVNLKSKSDYLNYLIYILSSQ